MDALGCGPERLLAVSCWLQLSILRSETAYGLWIATLARMRGSCSLRRTRKPKRAVCSGSVLRTRSALQRSLAAVSVTLSGVMGCNIGVNPSSMDVSGEWLGTVVTSASGDPVAEAWEYRLSLNQTGTQLSGTSRARTLTEPRYYVDFELTGEISSDGRLALIEGKLLDELRPPNVVWCPLRLTLERTSANGRRLKGEAVSPGCPTGIVSLHGVGVSVTGWPTAPSSRQLGFDSLCDDWPNHPSGCFWLTANGWRDAQPMRRHRNPVNGKYHLGADWNLQADPTDCDLPVHAIADGKVVLVVPNYHKDWGNVLFVFHDLPVGTFTSMYGHVNWRGGLPSSGDTVARGTEIARIGRANPSEPCHLHLEIRPGLRTMVGDGYAASQTSVPPNGQVDPNIFIRTYR